MKAAYSNDTDVFYINEKINFLDKSAGKVISWEWDFGDGGKSTDRNPTHVFKSTGYFYVQLKVGNGFKFDSVKSFYYLRERTNVEIIGNILSDNFLDINPNPAESFIKISFPPSYQSSPIKIYSIEGIEVLETEYKDKIDVSSFSPGVYYVKFGDRVCRFVKI